MCDEWKMTALFLFLITMFMPWWNVFIGAAAGYMIVSSRSDSVFFAVCGAIAGFGAGLAITFDILRKRGFVSDWQKKKD